MHTLTSNDLKAAGAEREFVEWAREWDWACLTLDQAEDLLLKEYRYAWRAWLREHYSPTLDDVEAAAQRLFRERGVKELRWMFQRFGLFYGTEKIADLKPEKYREVILRINDVLATGGSFAEPSGCRICGYHKVVCACRGSGRV
ncbi:MAG TPA: hypothetical protein VFM34_05275 [Moraxellaceae bacterium]|nr:hypothetical protein [Moraxellaceae bacterium]